MNIYFDSVNLNSSPYSVVKLGHESAADRETILYPLARARGAVIISAERKEKRIEVLGQISGANLGDLDTKIDALMELLARKSKNLDLDYATGTRRYLGCYCEGARITERHPTLAKWAVTVVVPAGVGQATSLTSEVNNNITSGSYAGSRSISGTESPRPNVKIKFDSNTGTNQIDFLVNGNKITYSNGSSFSVNDEVIFDFDNQVVTLNGVTKDYSGVFPEWIIGTNNFTVTTNGSARQYDLTTEYYAMYV